MIENGEDNGLEIGLRIIYDKEHYSMICFDGSIKDYPVGGLMCELFRLAPTEIKPIIMSCPGINEPATRDSIGVFICEFSDLAQEKLDPVPAVLITTEFLNFTIEWFDFKEHNGTSLIDEVNGLADNLGKQIVDFILEDTGYEGFGDETVLQLMLTAYASFSNNYTFAKYLFQNLMSEDDPTEQTDNAMDALIALYFQFMDLQHIDFKIFISDGKFNSLYTIESVVSLLIFETTNCDNKGTNFVKCANCGQYFVPTGRNDALYCTYPSPQNPQKSCRDVGAQIARANKEKNDVITREYRKIYMRYKMITRRHPENHEAKQKFNTLTSEIKGWRNNLANGVVTVDEFLEWLKSFES